MRDLYEGATGLDVLAMQKDLVAEGFLGRQHATGYVTSEIFPHLSTTTARACLASPIPVPACPHARAFPRTAGESPRSLSSSQTNLNVGRTRPRNLVPTISPRSVFTTATRSAVEKLQQQYGLPMTGIWGSLERGVFDTNARVLTAPPASAAALLPPDYNRTTSNVYAKAVGAVPAAAPAPAKAATSSGAVAIPGDVTGIAVCASAGFLTAAVVSKASAARRARRAPAARPPPAGAVVASAFETIVAAVRGLGGAPRHRGGSRNGYYDEPTGTSTRSPRATRRPRTRRCDPPSPAGSPLTPRARRGTTT